MNKSTANAMTEEELQEELISIYNYVKAGKVTYSDIKDNHDISKYALLDLKDMSQSEFERFFNSISYIKGELKEGKSIRKIAARMGCGSSILSFVVKKIEGNGETINTETEYAILRKKIELCWKEYKLGEPIEKLAAKHNMNTDNLKQLIDSFDNSLRSKRGNYRNIKKEEEKKAKAKMLKEKLGFDDDTIAYLLYGKEIEKQKEDGPSFGEL